LPAVEPAPDGASHERVQFVPLARLAPCPLQPRKDFAPEALQELADSIREQGVIQPLIVRPRGDGYELIAGERRWRAAQLAGLQEVPVIVREADDGAVLQLALIENLQRENLNPLEEAQGYAELVERFGLRQEDVAARVGKSRAAVANSLRLLRLPAEVQACLRDGRLSAGHAKVILGLESAGHQKFAAERIVKKGLSVRDTEQLVQALQQVKAGALDAVAGPPGTAPARDPHVADLENRLRERFGTKVALRYRKGQGALEVRFYSDAELERILEIVGVRAE
jgi:ParB family chromosome partitioning protein